MRITLTYCGTIYDIGDTTDNREALKEVGHIVSENRSETLILELIDGGTAILIVGPTIPLCVTYTDI